MADLFMIKASKQHQKKYEITEKDLPLSCPGPNQTLWDAHPRVYLPIEKTGKARCSYCSTEYVLKK